MEPTFKDKTLQERFNKLGYVVLPSSHAFDLHEIKKQLITLKPSDNYQGNQETKIGKQSFHVTFFDKNDEYKQQLFSYIKDLFSDFSKNSFISHKCCQANVFLKQPKSGYVYPHQNLTIVDEKEYTSFSCWMPLQDTNFENGTVCLIPGSHNHFQAYRNTHIYWPYIDFFKNDSNLNYFKAVDVKAGEILILDDRLAHYTPENKSNDTRWVLHSLWAPTQAQIKFYDVKFNMVDEYNVAHDFWQHTQPFELPLKNNLTQSFKFIENNYSDDELMELLNQLKVINSEH